MTTATKAGGAVLPVVAHEYTDRRDGYRYVSNACASETLPEAIALTPHEPAQATIDELRAEVERLRVVEFNSAVQFRDAVQPLREEVERLKRERWVAIQRELDALKAEQIDVDAVMRLADAYAEQSFLRAQGEKHTEDAAREAFRAELTKGST